MSVSMGDLKIGDSGVVTGYAADAGPIRARLLAMGLTRGTQFKFMRTAPAGDPIELHARGFSLSIRRSEAASLVIERVSESGGDCSRCGHDS